MSSRFAGFVRDLGPEHGFRASSFENKGKSWIFIFVGIRIKKKMKKNKWHEISQMLVSRALDDTKNMRKAGADIFAKSGPEKPHTNQENNQKQSPGFSRFSAFFPWT